VLGRTLVHHDSSVHLALADAVIRELGLHRVIDVNRSVPQTRYVTGWKADDE